MTQWIRGPGRGRTCLHPPWLPAQLQVTGQVGRVPPRPSRSVIPFYGWETEAQGGCLTTFRDVASWGTDLSPSCPELRLKRRVEHLS